MELVAPVLASSEGGLNPLHFDPSAFVLTLIIFLLLLALLVKFAWNPILDALDAREKRIEDSVTSAERARREAEELVAGYKAKLADAERQVAVRIEEGKAMAERQGQEIVERAREAADRERVAAVRDIGLEKQRALSEIRSEAVTLSRMIAEKAISRGLDAEDHRRLAEEFLAAMK
ncbi:MAG: F0F1 ATP synthase subunit B [Planctomycetes bacterium]|nr:F0F1 ATP synthase subunit B [Planctomycetota bacterium]